MSSRVGTDISLDDLDNVSGGEGGYVWGFAGMPNMTTVPGAAFRPFVGASHNFSSGSNAVIDGTAFGASLPVGPPIPVLGGAVPVIGGSHADFQVHGTDGSEGVKSLTFGQAGLSWPHLGAGVNVGAGVTSSTVTGPDGVTTTKLDAGGRLCASWGDHAGCIGYDWNLRTSSDRPATETGAQPGAGTDWAALQATDNARIAEMNQMLPGTQVVNGGTPFQPVPDQYHYAFGDQFRGIPEPGTGQLGGTPLDPQNLPSIPGVVWDRGPATSGSDPATPAIGNGFLRPTAATADETPEVETTAAVYTGEAPKLETADVKEEDTFQTPDVREV